MPAILGLLLRGLAILLVLRLLFRFLAGLIRGYQGAPSPAPPRRSEMVRDRVCNTFLPRDRALRTTVSGREEYFCSTTCRDRAIALAASTS